MITKEQMLEVFLCGLFTVCKTLMWLVLGLLCLVFCLLVAVTMIFSVVAVAMILWALTGGWILVCALVALIAYLFWRLA